MLFIENDTSFFYYRPREAKDNSESRRIRFSRERVAVLYVFLTELFNYVFVKQHSLTTTNLLGGLGTLGRLAIKPKFLLS